MDPIYDLTDLARRPILLNVICQTLPRSDYEKERIEAIDICHGSISMWLEREKWKGIDEEDIKHSIMELALDTAGSPRWEIPRLI